MIKAFVYIPFLIWTLLFPYIDHAYSRQPKMLEMLNDEISGIVDKVRPSLVIVEADFPQINGVNSRFTVTGTGIMVTERYIATSASLADGKSEFRIVNKDNESIAVELLAIDKMRGIAILETEENILTPIKPGNIDELRLGSYLVVIGNTPGIEMASIVGTFNGIDNTEGKLKVVVNLTSGFSGAAVVNTSGELVGTLVGEVPEYMSIGISSWSQLGKTAIFSPDILVSTQSTDYGDQLLPLPPASAVSARSIDDVLKLVKQIENDGVVQYGYLGISQHEIIKRVPGVTNTRLVKVTNIVNDSPADSAGILEDDYIVNFDGKEIFSANQLYYLVKTSLPNEYVDLSILHDDTLKSVRVKIGKIKKDYAAFKKKRSRPELPFRGFSPKADFTAIKDKIRSNKHREILEFRIEKLNTQMLKLQQEIKKLNTEIQKTEELTSDE
ncbi:MAG: serine protease [candidate division Zixibacteria bacterium]|nr:serine protease [candidate division Zixibacteria bacterium]